MKYSLGSSSRRGRAALPLGVAALVGLPLFIAGGSPSVSAVTPNLPVFPNNLVVFPNRDFVTIEGFSEYQGKTGLVEVTRPKVGVVGSAEGVMSGEDVAFEINHPGGYCWGEGTGLDVTPDIQAGDIVSLSIDGEQIAATTTLDVAADDAVMPDAKTVVVTGRIGDGVISDQMEQRIIEPALVDTSIARRDVRALPGPMVPSDKGGYSSELLFDEAADTFKATYVFDVESEAFIAAHAGLGERAMAWELVDEQGNRQGLTIAENGEPGGPGMGGCPNGPLQSGPPGPSKMDAVDVTGGIKVNWTPAVAIPGTPAILGYRVTAVSKLPINGEFVEIGRRIMNPAASSTTLTGVASAGYNVNVVSLSDVGETFPALPVPVKAPDTMAPTVSASPSGGSYSVAQQVTLTSNEFGADIYFTLDGSNPITGGQLSSSAARYTAPITVSAATTLKFVAFDPSNNVSSIVTEEYTITNDPVAAAARNQRGHGRSRRGDAELGGFRSRDPGGDHPRIRGQGVHERRCNDTGEDCGDGRYRDVDHDRWSDRRHAVLVHRQREELGEPGVRSAFGEVRPGDPAGCSRCRLRALTSQAWCAAPR